MFDKKKRITIKAFSGIAAASLLPKSLSAATNFIENNTVSTQGGTGSDISISMVSGHDRWHSVRLTNTGSEAVTVKHVYPGLVSVDNKKYDINTLFRSGPIVIQPGESHLGAVSAKSTASVEQPIPSGLTQQNKFQLASQYSHFGQVKPVVTMRSFYA